MFRHPVEALTKNNTILIVLTFVLFIGARHGLSETIEIPLGIALREADQETFVSGAA